MNTSVIGYPRIGKDRELKFASEKFFNGEEFNLQEIRESLRIGVLNGELTPLIVGSATKNIGVQTLLNMFINYLPNPNDLKPLAAQDENGNEKIVPTSVDEPFSAYCFKTVVDPYTGTINILKVCSGVLHVGDEVYMVDSKEGYYRISSDHAKYILPKTKEVKPGDDGVNKLSKQKE